MCAGQGDGTGAKLFPLSHFFDLDHLVRFAEGHNISLAHALPPHLVAACLTELNFPVQEDREELVPDWTARFGVICLPPLFSWNYLAREATSLQDKEIPWTQFRKGLIPARHWEGEIDALVATAREKIQGFADLGFHVVHARTEAEFNVSCSELTWHIFTYCFVSDGQITKVLLEKFLVPRGEPIFISSTENLSELPILCAAFWCFDLPQICPECMSRSYLEQAHLRMLFALRGKAAYGNYQSTFFWEMSYAMEKQGKFASHYNEVCDSGEHDCRFQGGEVPEFSGVLPPASAAMRRSRKLNYLL